MFAAVRLLLSPFLFLLLYGAMRVLWRIVSEDSFPGHLLSLFFLACCGGFLFRVVLGYAGKCTRISNPFDFLDTLEHELTHALVGYLTLSPPLSLLATLEHGGEVQLKRSNPLIALAPYGIPLAMFFSLALGMVIKPSLQPWWNLLPYVLLGNFLYRVGAEFRWYQEDLKQYGRLFSTACSSILFLASLTVLWHATGVLAWGWVRAIGPEMAHVVQLLLK